MKPQPVLPPAGQNCRFYRQPFRGICPHKQFLWNCARQLAPFRRNCARHLSAAALSLAMGAGVAAQAPSASPIQITSPAYSVRMPTAAGPLVNPQLLGGVPQGRASAQPLRLSLAAAVTRGLRANLGLLLASSESRSARAARLAALAQMLPQVQAQAYDLRQKISLAAMGISFPGVPPLIGPFNVADARLYLNERLLSVSHFQQWRASRAGARATGASFLQIRNLVVEAVRDQYQLTLAEASSLAAARAQLATANQAWRLARDQEKAGLVNALDVLRAQVQRSAEQQSVISTGYALAQQRLQLARMIGLPDGQPFVLTGRLRALPPPALKYAAAVGAAWRQRPDLRAARLQVRAAQLAAAAAFDRRFPQFDIDANYGTIGHTFDRNHPTFLVEGSLSMPLFTGGAIRAASAAARQKLLRARERLADLRAAVAQQVRDAMLNLHAGYLQVAVARQGRDYARQELRMARDRFRAGVADNLDEVRAEQAVAESDQSYITSLYQYNAARAALATALGQLPRPATPGAP